jgi:thymidylate synthase
MYEARFKPNQLIYGIGSIVVITGWTVKETLFKKLDPQTYSVIGQLYSPTRGINFFIRNCLFNPHVRDIVLLDATKEDLNAGSCQCLLDFFRYGFKSGFTDTDQGCWEINSTVKGFIDSSIPEEVLNKLRQNVNVYPVHTVHECVNLVNHLAHLNLTENKKPWGEPLYFPVVDPVPVTTPGVLCGHRIEGKTIADTWVKIVHRIKTTGVIRRTGYDGNWQELINLMAIVTDEPEDSFPTPNYLPISREYLQGYIPQILDDPEVKEGVKYTYGQRLRSWFGRDQIEQVINKLVKEIDAASAVMSLWDVLDHEKGGSPCLNHIWVRVVENCLSLTAVFRSNDMFSAWVANAMGLRALQRHIVDEINLRSPQQVLKMGELITISQSAHIYDDCWENADFLIKNQYSKLVSKRDYDDPSGNYIIEVEEGQIIVVHTTPGSGNPVKEYRRKNPLTLLRDICSDVPAIQPEHAGYLGMEFQKAYEAIQSRKPYKQDH